MIAGCPVLIAEVEAVPLRLWRGDVQRNGSTNEPRLVPDGTRS
jgi:hypothetical protein